MNDLEGAAAERQHVRCTMWINRSRLVAFAYSIVLVLCASIDSGCSETVVCFGAGTRIETPGGSIPVEQLKIGDAIVSVDPIGGGETTARVQSVEVAVAGQYIDLRTAEGARVGVTHHHPFWATDVSRFVPIGELAINDGVGTWTNG